MDELITPALQKKYIDRRKGELVDAEAALVRQDFKFMESFGHKLKGNGESFGFPDLTVWGSQIEIASKEKDLERVQALFLQIKNFVNQQF